MGHPCFAADTGLFPICCLASCYHAEPAQLLECRYHAKGILAARANRVAGEQSSEVDEFERVTHVCDIALKPHRAFFTLENIGSHAKDFA